MALRYAVGLSDPANRKRSRRLSLRQALVNLPEAEQQTIVEGYRNGMGQARRIDYLFHMGKPPKLKACLGQALFGEPTAFFGQPGSDHYGVLNTYDLDPAQC